MAFGGGVDLTHGFLGFFFFFFEYFISFYHNTIGCGFPDVSASGVGLSYDTLGFSFLSFFFSLNVFCYCSCFGCSFFLLWMQFGEGVNKGCGCLDYTFCCNYAMECGLLAAAWVAFSGVGLDCDCRFFFFFPCTKSFLTLWNDIVPRVHMVMQRLAIYLFHNSLKIKN